MMKNRNERGSHTDHLSLDEIQKSAKMSLVNLAKLYATRGLSLKSMSVELQVDYSSLKGALKLRGYKHPVGIELIQARFLYENGRTLFDYLRIRIASNINRNAISEETGIDNSTLQKFADANDLVFPKCSRPREYHNIISAMKSRQKFRTDLRKFTYQGKVWYAQEIAEHFNLSRGTFIKRINNGWSLEDAIATPPRANVGLTQRCNLPDRPRIDHPWRKE